jgi:hypothetical protein
MGQYWKIFNLTQGVVLFVNDGSKYCEKSISIDILLYLLQDEWKNNKIVMIGDYDETEKSVEFTREFLSNYDLTLTTNDIHFNNLYNLHFERFLPKRAYESGTKLDTTYLNMELQQRIIHYYQSTGVLKKDTFYTSTNKIYFVPNKYDEINEQNLIMYKPVPTEDTYAFIDHSNKEYVLFDKSFFNGFYDKRTKKALNMTIIEYNHLVEDIVLGLITNNSEVQDTLTWHGRFAGHSLSFEQNSDILSTYNDISSLFTAEHVDKNSLTRDFSDIIYTLDPIYDLEISDEEEDDH